MPLTHPRIAEGHPLTDSPTRLLVSVVATGTNNVYETYLGQGRGIYAPCNLCRLFKQLDIGG